MTEQGLPVYGIVTRALIRCIDRTVWLLKRRRVHLPSERVGMRLRFAGDYSSRAWLW